jgi:hypothetical protein
MHNHISVIYNTLQSIRNTRRAVQRCGDYPQQLAALRTIEHRAQALLRALQEKQHIEQPNYQNDYIPTATARAAGLAVGGATTRHRRVSLGEKPMRRRYRGTQAARWQR